MALRAVTAHCAKMSKSRMISRNSIFCRKISTSQGRTTAPSQSEPSGMSDRRTHLPTLGLALFDQCMGNRSAGKLSISTRAESVDPCKSSSHFIKVESKYVERLAFLEFSCSSSSVVMCNVEPSDAPNVSGACSSTTHCIIAIGDGMACDSPASQSIQ
jgi:hypothetical protein